LEDIDSAISQLTIADLFEKSAGLNSQNVALVYNNEQLTYAELNFRANNIAELLITKGIRPESLVPICLNSGIELIIGIIAILKAGGAYVPIDPEYPEFRIKYILDDCNAKIVLTTNSCRLKLEKLSAVDIIDLDKYPTQSQLSKKNPDVNLTPGNLAYVMYTSGTTGLPNGVMIEHHSVVNNLKWSQNYFRFSPADIVLQKTTFCFDVSLWEIFAPLIAGSKLIIINNEDYKDIDCIKETIVLHKINVIHFVPTMLEFFLLNINPGECNSLKRIICSGEALTPYQANLLTNKIPGARLYNLYGPTETTIHSTYWAMPDAEVEKVLIGKPVYNTQILILNDLHQLADVGDTGEIYINGAGLARGYLNNDDLTANRFIQNPLSIYKTDRLFKTGDLGRYSADGNIEYLGRIDDQVKINGYRIELLSVEANIKNSGLVKHAAVLTNKNALGSTQIMAYVMLDTPGDLNRLWVHLISKLPGYMLPASIKEVDEIPLTLNGKIDKHRLLQTGLSENKNVPPRSGLESKVMTIWAALFATTDISIYDNFFELGGNSIVGIKMLSQLKKETGKHITYIQLNQFPTIESFAKLLDKQDQLEISDTLVNIKRQGNKPPLYLVNGGEFVADGFFALSEFLDKDQPVYGFQSDGYDNSGKLFDSIEAIAAHYIESILSNDNNGPYCLGGYSLGGPIAFEMARQLKASGKKVKLLAMIDSLTRDPGIIKTHYSAITVLRVIGFNISLLLKYGFKTAMDYSLGVINSVLKRTKTISSDLPETAIIYSSDEDTGVDVFSLHIDVYKKYKIIPYDGNLVVFRAKKVTYYMDDLKYLGWKPFAKRVKSTAIEGDHFSIFDKPNIAEFGSKLQQVLDEGF
jgi:amino acid adenylation domain-containing protein